MVDFCVFDVEMIDFNNKTIPFFICWFSSSLCMCCLFQSWNVLLPVNFHLTYDTGNTVGPGDVVPAVVVYFGHGSLREMQVVDIATFMSVRLPVLKMDATYLETNEA